MSNDKKPALDSAKYTGYYLRDLVESVREYGLIALQCSEQFHSDNGDNLPAYKISPLTSRLLRLIAYVEEEGEEIHKEAAKINRKLGYENITNADFLKIAKERTEELREKMKDPNYISKGVSRR